MIVHPGGNFPFFIQTIFCFDDAEPNEKGPSERGTKSLGFGSSFLNSLRDERAGERKNAALGRVDFLQLVGSSSLNVRNGYHGMAQGQTTADDAAFLVFSASVQ